MVRSGDRTFPCLLSFSMSNSNSSSRQSQLFFRSFDFLLSQNIRSFAIDYVLRLEPAKCKVWLQFHVVDAAHLSSQIPTYFFSSVIPGTATNTSMDHL